ncbi:MAG: rhomboid family intramembrane serine protease, partial [Candidatus Aenigmatarchaeota archaeon]
MIPYKFSRKIIEDIKKHKIIYFILSTILVTYLLQRLYSLKFFLGFRAAKLSLANIQTLLTYALAHKNLSHLLGNSIGILIFGRFCEERMNNRNTLLLFLLAVTIPPILLYFLYIAGTISRGIVGASSGIMG